MESTVTEKPLHTQSPKWLKSLLWRRYALFIGADNLFIAAAAILALSLAHGSMALPFPEVAKWCIGLALLAKLPVFYSQGLYNMSWRYVSMRDLLAVARGVTLGSLAFTALLLIASRFIALEPLYILIPIDFLITLFLVGGFRASRRAYFELRQNSLPAQGRRILVVGAGSAGEQLVRAMRNDIKKNYTPVGYIDDDPDKRGTIIHGVKVLGGRQDLARIARAHQVSELLIAIPSAPGPAIREFVELAREAGISRILTVPPMVELFSHPLDLSKLQDVRPEDLLRRDPVNIDTQEVEGLIRGAVVLVTGAGGSIGSELCRQIAQFGPSKLLLFERDETSLFDIHRQLLSQFPNQEFEAVLGDVRNRDKLGRVFAQHQPRLVFHAAAYKHVPLMEANPSDAVSNNVVGTRALAEASLKYGAERFVLISTDKAVNPSSVMGATKRLAEEVVRELNGQGVTRCMAVRFGNVLGSRGSVIPIFKEQIMAGGPVTITHPEMRRYFMTATEAVLLVLQAAAIGQGGEVFVLDMGEPVKIVDLAKDMIRMAGKTPDVDIPIVFTGMRPGEKLFEDLLSAEEGTEATRRDRIYVARMRSTANGSGAILPQIDHIEELLSEGNDAAVLAALQQVVSTYKSNGVTSHAS